MVCKGYNLSMPRNRKKDRFSFNRKNGAKNIFWPLLILVLVFLIFSSKNLLTSKTTETAIAENKNESVIKVPFITPKYTKEIFGTSTKGKEIEGYIFGSGGETYLFFSAIHGTEMGTTPLLTKLVEELKKNPDLVSKNKKIIIIPCLNPDGYYDRVDKFNANDVNLNLNFQTSDWQQWGPEGSYAGDAPFSENESRLIRDVVEKYKPKTMISYHAKGSIVNPEANTPSRELAEWYVRKTNSIYTYFEDWEWDYPGTATKWFIETTGGAAITVELSDFYNDDWEVNKTALFELIK